MQLFDSVEELRLLGITGTLFRIYFEIKNKISLFSLKEPPYKKPLISFDEWKKSKKIFLPQTVTKKHEDVFSKNTYPLFSKSWETIPLHEWHLNPFSKKKWPNQLPSEQITLYEKTCGDIKLAWEKNRFSHIYLLIRAYSIFKNKKYVHRFCEELRSWNEYNSYNKGINWFNAQELAIRLLAWISGVYTFSASPSFLEKDFNVFLRQLYLHTAHIDKKISYAYFAVHNNHLIGEALGLFISGLLFPFFPESKKWKEKGKQILEGKKCLNQFYNDGGYCQLSHNYHRLALHYYLWYVRLCELNQETVSEDIYSLLKKSENFLLSFINTSDGRLPNWGANDGALLNPISECDYTDFRPLLQNLHFQNYGKRLFQEGPWDDEMTFFHGLAALTTKTEPPVLTSTVFKETGLHILRKEDSSFLAFRCGSIKDRFGQADMLHVDLWWKGQNIALDGGSYLYNEQLEYHRYFMGTASHNTVLVNSSNQMYHYRRFKWLHWTKANLIEGTPHLLKGEHYGYLKTAHVLHQRTILMTEAGYTVTDELIPTSKCTNHYQLHWALFPFDYTLKTITPCRAYLITLTTTKGPLEITLSVTENCELSIESGIEKPVRGWHSRYYAHKEPCLSVMMECDATNTVEFKTTFQEPKQ